MRYYGMFQDIKDTDLDVIESEIYDDYFAEFYHKFCGITTYDLDFYLQEAFSFNRRDIKILELACGTGRITIPLLERGFTVEAIDLSESMLGVLRRNLEGLPRKLRKNVNIKNMNILDLDYEEEFDMVIFPATTICLLNEEEISILFNKVYKSIKKGGKFIFDYKNEDESKSGFINGNRNFIVVDKNEDCIYQEFIDYDNHETIVNFYVEKDNKKYLSSTTKNMMMKRNIENHIINSYFDEDNCLDEHLNGDVRMNVLMK